MAITTHLDIVSAEREIFSGIGNKFYSDGIIEAKNSARELFSQKRLMELLSQTSGESLPRSIEKIAADTEAWCKPLVPDDDVTLLGCEFPK